MGKKGFVSVFGAVSTQTYNRIHRCEEEIGRKMSMLVLDALDGLYVVPFARMGNYIDAYVWRY